MTSTPTLPAGTWTLDTSARTVERLPSLVVGAHLELTVAAVATRVD